MQPKLKLKRSLCKTVKEGDTLLFYDGYFTFFPVTLTYLPPEKGVKTWGARPCYPPDQRSAPYMRKHIYRCPAALLERATELFQDIEDTRLAKDDEGNQAAWDAAKAFATTCLH
jgi:hypothetical protein